MEPLFYRLNFASVIFQVVVPHVLGHRVEVMVHGENETEFSIQKTAINEIDLEEGPEWS